MTPHRNFRHLIVALGVLLAMATAASTASATTGYGELTRFGAREEQLKTGTLKKGFLAGQAKEEEGAETYPPEINYSIGVDPSEQNAVFVLDEPDEPAEIEVEETKKHSTLAIERHVRIQKFDSSTGQATASREFIVTSPKIYEEDEAERNEEEFSDIAVNPTTGVLYVLSEERRKEGLKRDEEAAVATTLFAFNTKGLEPAEHTKTENGVEGVLAGPAALEAESETAGKPLIEPRGITVDPKTGEIIILAHDDEGSAKGEDELASTHDHFLLQRVSDEGKLGERYVDKTNFFKKSEDFEEPSSPVVTTGERVLVHFQGLTEVPYKFSDSSAPTQVYSEEDNESIINPAEENESGGALALSPEGTIYEPVSIANEREAELNDPGKNWGIAARKSTGDTGLIGWTGGESALLSEEHKTDDKCVLQPETGEEPPLEVAAGSEGKVFALSPEFLAAQEAGEAPFPTTAAIVEFGPGGKGCPAASGSSIKLTSGKVTVAESTPVSTGQKLQLSTMVKQADALAATWVIEDKSTPSAKPVEITPNPLEFVILEAVAGEPEALLQQPILNYTFTAAGEYVVTAKVATDDLAGSETGATGEVVEAKARTIVVEAEEGAPAAPKVTRQPADTTVTEPNKATFVAEASGSPKPTVQWEVSTDKGVTWTSVAGATSKTLTIEGTSVSENGNQYEAVFKNVVAGVPEEAVSKAATLTVNKAAETPPPPPPPPPTTTTTPSTTTTTPTQQVLPSQEGKPAAQPIATVASASFFTVSSAGAVTLEVKCPAGETKCVGSLTLKTLTAVAASRTGSDAKAKRAILTLATASFSVTGGGEEKVTLRLSSTARKLLAHDHTLRVRATLVAHDLAGAKHTTLQTVTLRLVSKKK
jgi:Immunoglobulin I-set domain